MGPANFRGTIDQLQALLAGLHPAAAPEVEATRARIGEWQIAVARAWAARRRRWSRLDAEARLDALVDSLQAMCIGTGRMGPEEAEAAAEVRLGLMPDGVGQALNQPWAQKLRWLGGLCEALTGPYREAVAALELTRNVSRAREWLDRCVSASDALSGLSPRPDIDAVERAWRAVIEALRAALNAHARHAAPASPPSAPAPRRRPRRDDAERLTHLALTVARLSAPSAPCETRSDTSAEP